MNLVLVGVIWRGPNGRGSAFKVEGQRKIRGPAIGAMQWTTRLAIGTGQSLFALVGTFHLILVPKPDRSFHTGTLLAKKYNNALVQSAVHIEEFAALCTDIPQETLDSWTARILAWELDRDQPNPYFNLSSGKPGSSQIVAPLDPVPPGPSESEIRKRLTLEEEQDELASASINISDDATETKYLLLGLDLEPIQCVFSGSPLHFCD